MSVEEDMQKIKNKTSITEVFSHADSVSSCFYEFKTQNTLKRLWFCINKMPSQCLLLCCCPWQSAYLVRCQLCNRNTKEEINMCNLYTAQSSVLNDIPRFPLRATVKLPDVPGLQWSRRGDWGRRDKHQIRGKKMKEKKGRLVGGGRVEWRFAMQSSWSKP